MLPKHFTFFMDLFYLVFFPGKIITKRNTKEKNPRILFNFRTVAMTIVLTQKFRKVTYKRIKTSFINETIGLTMIFGKSHNQI